MVIGIDASRTTGGVNTGTERYSQEVIRAIVHLAPQHEYTLYVRAPLSAQDCLQFQEKGMHVRVVPIRRRRLWSHVGLAGELARRPPDALFVPAHVLPLPQAIWPTTRTVVIIHDVGYRHFADAHPWLQRVYLDWSTGLNARCASAVAVDSQTTRQDVQRFYHTASTKMTVAYPGPIPLARVDENDVVEARRKFGLREDTPFALYVGTLQPRKNLRRLIHAWRHLLDDCRTAHSRPQLLLAGAKGWGGEDLQSEAFALGLADKVLFGGYISDVEKSALLRSARAFAFPSLYEGFGLPVLEAQSAGVPVVCSNTSSLPEVAGDAAVLVDPMDEKDIARGLQRAMFDDSVRTRLTEAGPRNVRRFSWEQCARIILDLLVGTNQ